MSDYILKMLNITKEFYGIKALDNVNFEVQQGEIHALVGENGAGKSTLINVLGGVYPYGTYKGKILYEGKECKFTDIRQSEDIGIVIIHQELTLSPYLTCAENVFLGNEQSKNGIIDWGKTTVEAKRLFEKIGLDEDPNSIVNTLGIGKQQLIEIAKALTKSVKLLILDEPTAALNEEDSHKLLNLLLEFKKNGITSILISHKLKEVLKVADRITILRDGSTVETLINDENLKEEKIIKAMVGRDIGDYYPTRYANIGNVFFEIKNWTVADALDQNRKIIDDVGLQIRKGEVVGIAGLMGAGRTELAMSIFGESFGKKLSGDIFIDNKKADIKSVDKAIENGIAYVTEDRKTYGLILIDSVKNNISLSNFKKISKNAIINKNEEIKASEKYKNDFNIRAKDILQNTEDLSGGNQQKVVLSRWIFSDPSLLILDEPTRGIDVGAKREIYTIINRLAEEGKSILMISSELPELLKMCDRIYVMNQGRIVGELSGDMQTAENVMTCIMRDIKGGQVEYGKN
ncbi:sugar ABC transporter ATP-binding protein [Paratissierella segnis]|jgi:putative multiple sugar transport system ATP-binding protein|uniref:Sugar ABC transporter ATP-binding protein n=1 Tax=Paratissierella segnis TaxID=2763679 RepID=A0A926ESJ0_9FIRM|nr:sugar ABC transporter ATP-binding protein [Paratissierella segnis]MBC8588978.1 sugar ABC transporter ATP-binding protein [Paratissierella segnis]